MTGAALDPPLIGRTAPIAAIDELLQGACAGNGGLVLLVGDPGTGVSRMLQFARDRACRAGLSARATRAWFTNSRPGRREPALLTIDDAERADDEEVSAVLELAAHAAEGPLAVLVGATGDTQRLDPLRGAGRLVRLAALTAAEAGQLARTARPEAATYEVSALTERSRGNPFLLTQLLASNAPLPDGVRDWVSARAARLTEAELLLLRALAVVEAAPLRAVAQVAGLDSTVATAAADRLLHAGFLLPEQPARFAQPVVRDAVYAESPPFARADAHGRAARVLDALAERRQRRDCCRAPAGWPHQPAVTVGPRTGWSTPRGAAVTAATQRRPSDI